VRSRELTALLTTALALTLLALYPPAFRREFGAAFVDAALHRVSRTSRSHGRVAALGISWALLVSDTASAAPREWLAAMRGGPPGTRVQGSKRRPWMALRDDVRFASRSLLAAPRFTTVALSTLALTIGANTAIFSVADAVLFRPLPYPNTDELFVVTMEHQRSGQRFTWVPYAYVQVIEEHHDGLGPVGMLEADAPLVVPTSIGAERVEAARVTANYFEVLRTTAYTGRLFDTRDDPARASLAVLSHAFWSRHLGGDEAVIGTSVRLAGRRLDVVGVLPPGFIFPSSTVARPDIITLLVPPPTGTDGGAFHPIVRLAAGGSRGQAQAELSALAASIDRTDRVDGGTKPILADVRVELFSVGRPIARLLLAASILVLLIGCANLATILLVRASRRERETGMRAALGASRLRLVRPVVVEALLIALAGASLAALIAALSFDVLVAYVPPVAYGAATVGVDARVVGFTLALGLGAGLLFSVVPAWRAAGADAAQSIRGRSTHRYLRLGSGWSLVIVQTAVAVTLVFGATVTARALIGILEVPFNFEPEGVALVTTLPPPGLEGFDSQSFYRRAAEALRVRSEVVAVGATSSPPLVHPAPWSAVPAPGSAEPVAGAVHVLPGYFEAARIPLLRGRTITPGDVDGPASVAVASESAAARLFPYGNPIGARFVDGRGRSVTVVGIVADTRVRAEGDFLPPVYVLGGEQTRRLTLVVRTRDRRDAVLGELQRLVASTVPSRVVGVQWWDDAIESITPFRNPRFQALVLGGFGALGLALTGMGIFAVVAFLVASRTREMGIRLALGSTPDGLVTHVTRRALAPIVAGLLIGLPAASILGSLADAQLFEVDTKDPAMYATAAATVIAASLLAAWLPARRASRLEPMIAQRLE
jgi:putative ABC transport system permease protein